MTIRSYFSKPKRVGRQNVCVKLLYIFNVFTKVLQKRQARSESKGTKNEYECVLQY